MIRHISALAALIALSLSSVACVTETESEATEAAETSQELGSRSAFFETFQGLDGRHYFKLTAGNGESVLRSQSYATLAGAENGVSSVLDNASDARNFDLREASNGDYYFNVKADNGQIVGTSQLYATKSNADRGARIVRSLVRIARQEMKIAPAPRRERFELFTGEDGKSYFHLRAGNGEILLGSQGYSAKDSAKDGISSVRSNGANADRFEVFAAADGEWGVRLVAENGEIVARGETYASKSSATRAVTRITEILAGKVSVSE
jgi:uncharacterized protein